jgi:hypothetical protein
MSLQLVRRFWTGTALVVFNTMLVFLIVNGVCWAYLRRIAVRPEQPQWEIERRSGKPLKLVHPDLSEADIAQLMQETWTRTHAYEPFTGHTVRPFAGRFVNVDSNGYRRIAGPAPWPPARERAVFVFGGSTTFGTGVPDGETIPAFLQEQLRQQWGAEVSVYNFGRGYYYSSQERVLFAQLLEKGIVPRLAIFIDGLNDFLLDEPEYSERIRRFIDGDVPRTSLLSRLPAVVVLRGLLANWNSPANAGTSSAVGSRTDSGALIDRYLQNVRMIKALASAYDIPVLFVWQPIPTYKYDLSNHLYSGNSPWMKNSGDRTGDAYSTFAARLPALGLGEEFLWLADMQEDLAEPLYVDQVHYTGAMNRRIAEAIVTHIVTRVLPDTLH